MAETISTQGNPPLIVVDHGGGANLTATRDAGEEGGMDMFRKTCNSANNDYLNNKNYTRSTVNDAIEWKKNRKRKHPRTDGEEFDNQVELHDPIVAQLEAKEAQRYYDRWHVPRLGNLTQERPPGVFRIMCGQVNGASTTASRDKKVTDITNIIDTWDVQGGCLQELGINWSALEFSRNL